MKSSVWYRASAVVVLWLIAASGSGFGQGAGEDWGAKVDHQLRAAWHSRGRPAGGATLSTVKLRDNLARVLVVFDGEPAEAPGLHLLGRVGNVAAGLLDLDELPSLAAAPSIRYIRSERLYYPNDDLGVRSVRAPRTHSRLGVTGRGVLLGVIDTGIDWLHPDFIQADTTTRLEAVLDLSEPADSLGAGELGEPGPYGGIATYREHINAALRGEGTIRQADLSGHGSHVAGTAAATASTDSLNSLGGVAPGVSIVAVKATGTPTDSTFSDFNILNGIDFLDSLAAARGMPWVANLSLGSILGAHDGSDPMEQALESLVAESRPGRAIVVSSGNSRNRRTHAAGDFTVATADSSVLYLNLSGGDGGSDRVNVEVWLSEDHPGLDFELIAPDGSVYGPLADGDSLVEISDDGVLFVENARGGEHPSAGDRLISVTIADLGATNGDTIAAGNVQLAVGAWRLVMFSSTGSWDAWTQANSGVGVQFGSFVSQMGTVNVPGTSPALITVGAYNTRTGWWSISGGAGSRGANLGYGVPGELTAFTSLGPNRKGVLKPEVTAPGRYVMATISGFAWPHLSPLSIFRSPVEGAPFLLIAPDSLHAVSQGTSFSAPHVAGVAALLLEADPSLTNAEVKQLLTSTATTDSMITSAPDNFWGYGRANAAGAVASALDVQPDSVLVVVAVSPRDTVRVDTLRYTVAGDFSGSLQSPLTYSLEVRWDPGQLRLRAPLDTVAGGGALLLRMDADSLAMGVLAVAGRAAAVPPDSTDLLRLEFGARTIQAADSVNVVTILRGMRGDLAGGDILPSVALTQAGPVSLRLDDVCPLAGDIDGSGGRDIFDLLALLRVVGGRNEPSLCSDIDANGVTDIFDLLELLTLLRSD